MTFSDDYIDDHPAAFSQLLSWSVDISERLAAGKESVVLYDRYRRLLEVLLALRYSDDLTAKQTEALEYCLVNLTEDEFVPTVTPVYEYTPTVDTEDFQVGAILDQSTDDIGSVDDEGQGVPEQNYYA